MREIIATEKEIKEIQVKYYEYTVQDIKNLIIDDMREKGYTSKEVSFNTDYKYVRDDWGMNPVLTTRLLKAVVTVEG